MERLIDVYSNSDLFQVDFDDKSWSGNLRGDDVEELKNDVPVLFEDVRFKGSPGRGDGEPVIVDIETFEELFDTSTLGVLRMVDDWSNCIVAGGQVLACLQGMGPNVDKPSDIDIFMYGLEGDKGLEKVRKVLNQIYEGYKIANRCEPVHRPDVFIDVVRTDHTLTLIPKYEVRIGNVRVELPKVQIVTRKFSDPADILACFDVDCCCVAYDGTKVWASPRAVRALRTSVNIVDLKFRSATFENRLLKYTRRGFAIQDPGMKGGTVRCLENYFGREADMEKVDLENLVRCIRRSKGLLKLLLADLAGTRGVIWAGVIVETASFNEMNPEDGFEEKYGDKAINTEKGPLVFHPLLVHEPWMAQFPHRPLMKLLDEWANETALQNHFQRRGPEIDSSRADWEQGAYENSQEQIEALLKLAFPAPAPTTDSRFRFRFWFGYWFCSSSHAPGGGRAQQAAAHKRGPGADGG